MWIYRTGNPRGNYIGDCSGLGDFALSDFLFAAPSPRIAGRWAAYINLMDRKFTNGQIVAVEVCASYHRFARAKRKGDWKIEEHFIEDLGIDPRDRPWDGNINSLIDGEGFGSELPMLEVIYLADDIIGTRKLTKEERREYDLGIEDYNNYINDSRWWKSPALTGVEISKTN